MSELHRKPEVTDIPKPEASAFKEIKPETDMTVSEAKSFVDSLFKEKSEISDGYYNSYETRSSNIPVDGVRGHWEGERGESKYVPSDETEEGKAAQHKLSEKDMDGVEYRYAEPDFSECAEATVEIDNMTENRGDYYDEDGNLKQGNFSQADEKCAEQWTFIEKDGKSDWTAADVRDWRRDNECSWHERCDTRTMDLVSRDIHGYFGHYGGCAECKVRDAANVDGGGFDE